ncbi:hypothetical protein BC829DRAFT_46777 [Chytridium lagenaria]|nr:hypothetical protein BC829DRAFT_46777 [Chytridium lagenaria]
MNYDDDTVGAWRLVEDYPLSRNANDMVFDFSRYQLQVEEEESFEIKQPESCQACRVNDDNNAAETLWCNVLDDTDRIAFTSVFDRKDMMRYKVDVTPLQQSDRFESFNHAAHQCYYYPHLKMEMMDCLTYTHVNHVHLRCFEDLKGGSLSMLPIQALSPCDEFISMRLPSCFSFFPTFPVIIHCFCPLPFPFHIFIF